MNNEQHTEPKILPALRGIMGDWVYYSCLMDLPTLAARVHYAEEIHPNKRLSELIQRRLEARRAAQIANYLQTRNDRLFNALVIATYMGEPNWHALKDVRSRPDNDELQYLDDNTVSSVGFLTLSGREKLFALDGQHRLAGIKKAVKDGISRERMDNVPVLLVAHRNTKDGLRRTRRLFTTLNKTAKPVSKIDIIALDEDNVMALVVRWLLDDNRDMFGDERIAFVASNNMPRTNCTSLTTVVNLYNVLQTWYRKAQTSVKTTPKGLQTRPDENQLMAYYKAARGLFEELSAGFPELDEFFSATDTEAVVRDCRGSHGGSVLFRPIGLHIFVEIIAQLSNEMDVPASIEIAAKLPRQLTEAPYAELMWDTKNGTVARFSALTLREVLLYMLGRSNLSESELLTRYRREVGDDSITLPARVA